MLFDVRPDVAAIPLVELESERLDELSSRGQLRISIVQRQLRGQDFSALFAVWGENDSFDQYVGDRAPECSGVTVKSAADCAGNPRSEAQPSEAMAGRRFDETIIARATLCPDSSTLYFNVVGPVDHDEPIEPVVGEQDVRPLPEDLTTEMFDFRSEQCVGQLLGAADNTEEASRATDTQCRVLRERCVLPHWNTDGLAQLETHLSLLPRLHKLTQPPEGLS